MFKAPRLDFAFLCAFYIEYEVSVWFLFWSSIRGIFILCVSHFIIFIRFIISFCYVDRFWIIIGAPPFLKKRVESIDIGGLDVTRHTPTMTTPTYITILIIRRCLAAFVPVASAKDGFPTQFAVVALLANALEFALLVRQLLYLVVFETFFVRK